MISQNLSSQPLKRGRAEQSWVIPAVSPSLGKTWVSPHHQDSFQAHLHSSCSFMQLEQIYVSSTDFSVHFGGAHRPTRPSSLTWGYFSGLSSVKINKKTEELSLAKGGDFRARGKQQLPKAWRPLSAEWELTRGRAFWVNKQSGDTMWRTVDADEREEHKIINKLPSLSKCYRCDEGVRFPSVKFSLFVDAVSLYNYAPEELLYIHPYWKPLLVNGDLK